MTQTDEERKAYLKEYELRPEVKARKKARRDKPESKAKEKARREKPENKAKQKERMSTPEWKAKEKERTSTPEHKAKQKKMADNVRLKVLQSYSKHLSKSDIPCCWCCGESHIEFLAVDHIIGKKQMDSDTKLVKLGYSSSLIGHKLQTWIIKNNFPEGFRILCHNCNMAIGFYGKCPHKKADNLLKTVMN